MTIDKSLKIRSGTVRSRNVLTRAERLAKLKEAERWEEGKPVLGLPKVLVVEDGAEEEEESQEGRGRGDLRCVFVWSTGVTGWRLTCRTRMWSGHWPTSTCNRYRIHDSRWQRSWPLRSGPRRSLN